MLGESQFRLSPISEMDEGERREGGKDISFAEDEHNAASVREEKKVNFVKYHMEQNR